MCSTPPRPAPPPRCPSVSASPRWPRLHGSARTARNPLNTFCHSSPPASRGQMSDRPTVLKINSVSAVSALSVIPAQAGIQATAQRCDEPPSARRPTRAPGAPRVIGRRRTLGAPLTPTDRLDSCLRRNDGTSSSRAGPNIQGGLPPRHHIHPRQRFETAPKCSPRGGAVAQRLRGRLPTPPACAVARPGPYLQLLPPRRPARNLHFPSPPASRGEMSDRATVLKSNSVSAVSALSVIPAPPPSFLRRQESRRPPNRATSSIRPTAHQSPRRTAHDRAPSNIGSALDPHRSPGLLPAQE